MKHWQIDNKHTSLNIDTLTLAALVHTIGVLPILTEAERHEEVFANPSFLEAAIKRMAGKLGGAIMRSWDFSGDFIVVAEKWNDNEFQTKEVSYIDFVRIGALYMDVLGKGQDNVAKYQEYVDKGVMDDPDYVKTDEFKKSFADIKTVFN